MPFVSKYLFEGNLGHGIVRPVANIGSSCGSDSWSVIQRYSCEEPLEIKAHPCCCSIRLLCTPYILYNRVLYNRMLLSVVSRLNSRHGEMVSWVAAIGFFCSCRLREIVQAGGSIAPQRHFIKNTVRFHFPAEVVHKSLKNNIIPSAAFRTSRGCSCRPVSPAARAYSRQTGLGTVTGRSSPETHYWGSHDTPEVGTEASSCRNHA